ncbi:type IV toxin-antitoxin system AbiEi family antitoxin [Aeromicrobium sp.]|uniref:type IV toxin-antitoxin system AbiEi family antitoxin n=1 Tax=Aeromicrobium sp. TaxID=1871063 RepID=UPI003C6B672E
MSDLIHDGMPFTSAMAPMLGLTPGRLRRHLAERLVRREFRDVYVDARVPDSRNGRLRAIALVAPRNAVACDETAAWLHGLDVFAPGRRHNFVPALVTRHGAGRVRHHGTMGRQAIIGSDAIDYAGGIHLTTPTRTASDLLRKMYRPYALAAADAFAHAGLVDPDELIQYVARLKGFRGIVQARSLAALVEARTQSAGESWQRLRILDAGFPPPDPQHEVIDEFGRPFYIDLPYPELLVGTEFDGREFHTDEMHRAHDRERRDYLTDVYGWRWVIGNRQRIFGDDTSFEYELGELLGIKPLSRWWGTGRN